MDRKEYICIRPCFHLGTKYRLGDRGMFAENELPRSSEKKDKNGKVIEESGQVRHFKPVGEAVIAAPRGETDIMVNDKPRRARAVAAE